MKRVVIVRHAKAVPYGYDDDFNRELTERGENDAKRIGQELRARKIMPEMIISNPARRALATARILAENAGFNIANIVENEYIYEGLTTNEFIDLIRKTSNNYQNVFFFGHNPGFHYFVNNLCIHFQGEMPTCSTVGIDFEVDNWNQIEARTGRLAFHFFPKMF